MLLDGEVAKLELVGSDEGGRVFRAKKRAKTQPNFTSILPLETSPHLTASRQEDQSVDMDDEEFDDLLAGVDLFEGSSQESLTVAAANLHFCEQSDLDEQGGHDVVASPPSSVKVHDSEDAKMQQITAQNVRFADQSFAHEVAPRNDLVKLSASHDHKYKYAAFDCIGCNSDLRSLILADQPFKRRSKKSLMALLTPCSRRKMSCLLL